MTVDCIICESQSSSYKCPVCYASYCSSACWKKHRDNADCHKPETTAPPPVVVKSRLHLTDDTVPLEKLSRLGCSEDLKRLLKDPLLKKLLSAVDNSLDPYESIQTAMQDPSFVEFVDKCLKMVEE